MDLVCLGTGSAAAPKNFFLAFSGNGSAKYTLA
jgi:hypothetical protein